MCIIILVIFWRCKNQQKLGQIFNRSLILVKASPIQPNGWIRFIRFEFAIFTNSRKAGKYASQVNFTAIFLSHYSRSNR